MDLNEDQQRAVEAVREWSKNPTEPFYLGGYAGTGKTTTAMHAAAATGRPNVFYVAPTGKAARRLVEKGCEGAQTLHSLLYKPAGQASHPDKIKAARALLSNPDDVEANKVFKSLDTGNLTFVQNDECVLAEYPTSSLVVVDEASMVSESLANDLLRWNVPVLALGDPAQLPPVKGTGVLTAGAPDALLTKIERQDEGGPVLDLATYVRQTGQWPDGFKFTRNEQALYRADQVICGTNANRWRLTQKIRAFKDFESTPVPGDKIIVKENNTEQGVSNGMQMIVLEILPRRRDLLTMRVGVCGTRDERVLSFWDGGFKHQDGVKHVQEAIDWRVRKAAALATFGQVITCHSAQGSEWNRVLVVDDSSWMRADRGRWRYTAITRAAKQVLVAKAI